MYLAKLRVGSARSLGALSSINDDDLIFDRYLYSFKRSYCRFFELQDILSATFKTISEAIYRFDSQEIPSGLCGLSFRCVELFFWMLKNLERYYTTRLNQRQNVRNPFKDPSGDESILFHRYRRL